MKERELYFFLKSRKRKIQITSVQKKKQSAIVSVIPWSFKSPATLNTSGQRQIGQNSLQHETAVGTTLVDCDRILITFPG